MKNNRNRKGRGFTLAELLIVVAIIAVLVSIAIPLFVGQRNRAIAAVNKANIRAARSAAATEYYSNDFSTTKMTTGSGHEMEASYYLYDIKTGTITKKDFDTFSKANSEAMNLAKKAQNNEIIDQVYCYIGESDQSGKITPIDIETAPHYHGNKVHIKNDTNPFGWYSTEED